MNEEFSIKAQESIKYYIYCLVDPKDKNIFYIGKGKGNRVFQHAKAALDKNVKSDKLELIRKIQRRHNPKFNKVKYYFLRSGIETEAEAYEYESLAIDLIRIIDKKQKPLTNIQTGSHSGQVGLMTLKEIKQKYEPEYLTTAIPVILITINIEYEDLKQKIQNSLIDENSFEQEIYERTRKSWVVSFKKVQTIKYALAVYRGYTVAAYEVASWNKIEADPRRCEFHGRIIQKDEALYQELVEKLVRRSSSKGSQNPIRYINCK